ncbi:hypothetical protein PWT90_01110 [Aphanocladium album]|nr:hypothetical protein PWT90_01110 [Aphanocladium album]
MESTQVAIVGAGPAGLVLALSLAAFNVQKRYYVRRLKQPINASSGWAVPSLNDSLKTRPKLRADGKTGIVRKQFLEPTAGIKQVQGTYRYEGTWIAANLRISLPTPDSHPMFPLWKLGYTPAQVYDLFWPQGWHFCSPPGKPTASGRFGPYDERLWRHEFREDSANADTDCEELLWDHLRPMISLWRDSGEGREFEQVISYPQDCIEVLRCRPFTFSHKVVNRWFEKRTILIGDAAHVFPPFAGQGIGSGFRDAHQLAWRLALLVSNTGGDASSSPPSHTALRATLQGRDRLLNSWEKERTASVDDAAYFSMLVGALCNKKPSLGVHLALKLQSLLEWCSFLPPSYWHPLSRKERQGFAGVRDGFHLHKFGGGLRLAQICLRSFPDNTLCLSDTLLRLSPSALTVFAIANGGSNVGEIYGSAAECIAGADLEAHILRKKPVVIALTL